MTHDKKASDSGGCGEIRSKKTYAAFVKALADTEPKK